MDLTAVEQKKTVFFFSDNHIVKKSFLEDVTFILNSGAIPKLYEGDELNQRREAMSPVAKQRGI
jgi:dynein heavy chain